MLIEPIRPAENYSDWSFLKWIYKKTILKFQRSSGIARLQRKFTTDHCSVIQCLWNLDFAVRILIGITPNFSVLYLNGVTVCG